MAIRNEKLPQQIPAHLDKWNWGAFLLHWIWGIGNSTYIAFLMFVPFVGFVMPFVLGAKGSNWAWQNQYWRDEEHFKSTQRKWAIGGVLAYLAVIILAAGIFFSIMGLMKGSGAYKVGMTTLLANKQVVDALGTPITEGFFLSGNISVKNSSGTAKFVINLTGSKASGKAFLDATKQSGIWTVNVLYVVIEGRKTPIVVINRNNKPIPGVGIGT